MASGVRTRGSSSNAANHARFTDRMENGQTVVLVKQVRSSEHAKPKTRGAIRALGLGRIGRINVQPDSPSTWGALRKVIGIVQASRFVYSEQSGLRKLTSNNGCHLVTMRYEAGQGGIGRQLSLPDGGVVFYERYKDFSTLTWPTLYSAADFFRVIRDQGKIDQGVVELFGLGNGTSRSEPIYRLVKRDPRDLDDIYVARFDDPYDGLSFVWQRSLTTQNELECGIASRDISWSMVENLIEATGTPSVKDVLSRLLLELKEA